MVINQSSMLQCKEKRKHKNLEKTEQMAKLITIRWGCERKIYTSRGERRERYRDQFEVRLIITSWTHGLSTLGCIEPHPIFLSLFLCLWCLEQLQLDTRLSFQKLLHAVVLYQRIYSALLSPSCNSMSQSFEATEFSTYFVDWITFFSFLL